jgi:hypothetical protein
MNGKDGPPIDEQEVSAAKPLSDTGRDECADIRDPVRRALCKVCNAPVMGNAPFCKDHEPPVP